MDLFHAGSQAGVAQALTEVVDPQRGVQPVLEFKCVEVLDIRVLVLFDEGVRAALARDFLRWAATSV
jgi:hypothetical protein